MRTGEKDGVTAAERGRAGMEVWLIPAAALLVGLLVVWILKPAIEGLLTSALVHDSDTMVLAWFRSIRTPALDRVALGITLLGSPFAMMTYAFLGLSILVNRRQWLLLFSWDVMFLGMWALAKTIKPLFARARPEGSEQFLLTTSFSFPSTHALSAIAAFGMMAFAFSETTQLEREPRAVLWLFTIVVVIAVGTTRLYLGVHYLSDVIAGTLIGGMWLAACLFAYRRARKTFRQPDNSPTSQS